MDKDLRIQLLILTMEECGEMIQACSKVYRKEANDVSLKMLLEETGDVYCMIELLIEHNLITWEDIKERALIKRNKLKNWSTLV